MTATSVPSLAHTQQGAPFEPPILAGSKEWTLHAPASEPSPLDAGTPDAWVPRDARLLRLTGRHPLNCEPPVDELMRCGFVTPPALHYVRNHGAAPRLSWATHRLTVVGLVGEALSFTMDELVALPAVTLPVTLVCAGNRRKEENMHKKSIGFNWGPGAVSTSYWTGVRLGDLLRAAGVDAAAGARAAQHVRFRGPAGELPKGRDGSYGTSLTLRYALDDANDVLVAYAQNGRWLTPDHGFPLRMVIPGHIGGRMVKWLSEIEVAADESDNHYHYFDNRVLPSHVDEALAKEEGWWYKPDFVIHELNINSAVAAPAHDETLALGDNAPYAMTGYAYSGGGRKVIRVEVSLDGGDSWAPAEIERGPFADPTAAGKHWCWVHWRFELDTLRLARATELRVRAWDSSMNTQPAALSWNLMGMMNNCHFRVLVHQALDAATGRLCLRFQHPAPVTPGALGGVGWREEARQAREGGGEAATRTAAAAPSSSPPGPATPPPGGRRVFSMADVEAHADEVSAWFVHEGRVYDATPFLAEHPGGADSILISAGQDATDEFNAIHSSKAKAMLKDYYIGDLGTEEEAAASSAAAAAANGGATATANGNGAAFKANGNGVAAAAAAAVTNGKPAAASANNSNANNDDDLVALDARSRRTFALAEREQLSRNVVRLRFALPSPAHRFGLPVGQHVFVYATVDGATVMRAYTPTTQDDDLGHFDLVVKVYAANEHPDFPAGGVMSQHMGALRVGDTVAVKGPVGHFVYLGRGRYTLNRRPGGPARRISLVAGGTGITPCWQVIQAVVKDDEYDGTEVALLYANRSEDDILLRDELDDLAARFPAKLRVRYTIDARPASSTAPWAHSVGRVDEAMLRAHALPPGDGAVVGVCGPPGLVKFACLPNLAKIGYTDDQVFCF